ncbi:MAG: hypothetical protein OXG04_02710 [Acidobacteria bacterium]|nr:hypothetical protein [Acidobacteriota bacterium]
MDNDTLWTTEGGILDDAGNLIMTSYVDLRDVAGRTPIRKLVKGCRREHALQDSETILISSLARFREEGENLIRDDQEGLATESTETVMPPTPAQAVERRRYADMNEAHELLDSEIGLKWSVTHRRVERSGQNLAFGKEWWIYSAAIAPETDEDWAAWWATLDPRYDHASEIGQPAKFAEALGRMVAEQLGPQGKDGWLQGTTDGVGGVRTKHGMQWVLHGPVVYADRLYDTLTREPQDTRSLPLWLFTKSATHAAMREYRFAILRNGTGDDKRFLNISGMMRDALPPTEYGLVRPTPEPVEVTTEADNKSSPTTGERKVTHRRATANERVVQRQENRSEVKGPDGQILTSNIERRENVREKTVITDLDPDDQTPGRTVLALAESESGAPAAKEEALAVGGPTTKREQADEDVVKELAFGGDGSVGHDGTRVDQAAVMGGGDTGVLKTLPESFEKMFRDPAAPTGPMTETWAESALGREEVLRIYRMIATLSHKVTQVDIVNRRDVASACWHAMQCIRNIYARLGDIVETVSIERERFVVMQLKESERRGATGRIVVEPRGGYAYCFKRGTTQVAAHGTAEVGMMFFPIGSDLDTFEKYGWPVKKQGSSGGPP